MIATRPRTGRRLAALACVLGLLGASTVGTASSSAPASAAGSSAVTKSKTVTRTFLDNGTTTTVEKNNVKFTVDETQDLHSLQLVHVSWSGAKPTGGLVADQNSNQAQKQEYPFAIFECRGTDTSTKSITPNTCWTQYADERFSTGYDDPAYPAWRSDSAATPAQRQAFVDAPSTLPEACKSSLAGTTEQRWVPFDAADGTKYPGGLFGCAGLPPEAVGFNGGSNLALPSNETFGVTDPKGNGSTDFDVFTNQDHASLGCSQTVACSIVAVPIEGVSCDPSGSLLPADQRPDADGVDAATQTCEAGPKYQPGQILPSQGSGRNAVSGYLWWSPSNWANRISIPLGFAPADNVCDLSSNGASVNIFGSEMMIQATTQWAPHFCLNKNLFVLKHARTPEPEARNLLAVGNIEAAYTSYPHDPGSPYPLPTVNAPVAVTGFGIGYTVDDANGKPITNLRLDARLLAKLLTESYPDQTFIKSGDKGLENNPFNITDDPEFQALNPGIPARTAGFDAAATLLTLNSDSDVTYALTSYLNADPEARAWLNGKPDPWGMKVNPAYKNIALPLKNFPLLDTYEPLEEYKPGRIDCLQNSPVPYLPLVAAPTFQLFSIGQDVQFALSQSQTTCVLPSPIVGSLEGAKMVAAGRQASGSHFMLGVVSLGDAAREGVQVASLQTHVDGSTSGKFTDAKGRSFAAPDQKGLQAAANTLQPDAKTGVWPVPYDKLASDADDSAAYPGTMVVYAAIPTKGLPNGDGPRYAKVLQFDAGEGQQPGTALGQLPPGYLPMTSANGLGQLAAYTQRAAKAVGAQKGYLPSLTKADPPATTPTTAPTTSAPAGGSPGTGNGPAGGNQPGIGGGQPLPGGGSGTSTGAGSAPTSKSSSSSAAPSGGASVTPQVASVSTSRVGSGIGGWVLPALLLISIVGLGVSFGSRLGKRAR